MVELRLPRALQSGIAVRCGMAGAGRGPSCAAGPQYPSAVRGTGAQRGAGRTFGAGRNVARGCVIALALLLGAASTHAQVISTRIWPAKDYTRVTLETKSEIKFQLFSVKDPERLVLDLEGVDLGPALAELH